MAVAESPPGLVHSFQVQGKFVLRVSQVSHPPPCKCHLCPPSCRLISVAERRESLHIGLESKGVYGIKIETTGTLSFSLVTPTCVGLCKSGFGRHTECRRPARRSPAQTPGSSRPPAGLARDPRGAQAYKLQRNKALPLIIGHL